MERRTGHVLEVVAIAISLCLLACEDFGPAAHPAVDAAPVTTSLMSCDGTRLNPDAVCTGGAATGSVCTMDCCYPGGITIPTAAMPTPSCGIANLGFKTCTCPNGVYDVCGCGTPPSWPSLPAGGDCTPKGTSGSPPAGLNGTSCTKEWTTCWTSEPAGNRGCVCIKDATTGNLNLRCGNPGTWFLRVRGITTEY